MELKGIHAARPGAECIKRPPWNQVVDESLHRLVGRPVGFRTGVLKSKFLNFFSAFSTKLICENLELRLHIGFAVFQLGNGAGTFFLAAAMISLDKALASSASSMISMARAMFWR